MSQRATTVVWKAVEPLVQWSVENPGLAGAALVVTGAGIVTIAAPMAIAGPALGAVGFGNIGVQAGSIAAGLQAANPPLAHGLFATMQSAAAGGYGVTVVSGVVQGAGAFAASAGPTAAWVMSKIGGNKP